MSLFKADAYYTTIDGIPYELFRSWGIKLIFVDRDNTCVPRSTRKIPHAVRRWFSELLREDLLGVFIVSNNIHTDQVSRSATELGIQAISHAMKPSCKVMVRVMNEYGCTPQETCVIGDQIFTDIVAGKRAGAKTILVKPQSKRDLWYTYVFRVIEWFLLRRVKWREL